MNKEIAAARLTAKAIRLRGPAAGRQVVTPLIVDDAPVSVATCDNV